MVLSVFSGNKDCPTRDVLGGEGKESYVFPAWKQSWAAVENAAKPLLQPMDRHWSLL